MSRLPDPTRSPNFPGRKLFEKMLAKRGRIDGMYRTMLNHPKLAERVSRLGGYLHFESGSLPDDLREMAVLRVAQRLGASYEWVKHVQPARDAGLSEKAIESLRRGTTPRGLSPLHRAALTAVGCVLTRKTIPQAVQDRIVSAVGIEGIIELVILCGFYRMIAGFLFAFDVPLPNHKNSIPRRSRRLRR